MTRRSSQEGMTLVELSVVVAVFMLVLVPILLTLVSSHRSTEQLRTSTEIRAQVRLVLAELTGDFRQAQSGDVDVRPVSESTASAVTFDSPDMSTPMKMRRIRYLIVGPELRRQMTVSTNSGKGPWTWPAPGAEVTVLDHLAPGSTFSYADSFGAATTSAAQVTQLTVKLAVDATPGPGGLQTFGETVEMRTKY